MNLHLPLPPNVLWIIAYDHSHTTLQYIALERLLSDVERSLCSRRNGTSLKSQNRSCSLVNRNDAAKAFQRAWVNVRNRRRASLGTFTKSYLAPKRESDAACAVTWCLMCDVITMASYGETYRNIDAPLPPQEPGKPFPAQPVATMCIILCFSVLIVDIIFVYVWLRIISTLCWPRGLYEMLTNASGSYLWVNICFI